MIYKGYIRKHDKKSLCYILAWIGLIITAASLGYESYRVIGACIIEEVGIYVGILPVLWFNHLHFFTTQSNILVFFCYICFIFFFHTWIFKKNTFVILTASYITVTLTIFWLILTPAYLIANEAKLDKSSVLSNIALHLVTPIIFILFTNQFFIYPNRSAIKIDHSGNPLKFGLIYPLCYCIYTVVINFIPLPESIYNHNDHIIDFMPPVNHRYISVYSIVTNYNNDCWIPQVDMAFRSDGGYFYNFGENGSKSMRGSLYFLLFFMFVFALFGAIITIYLWINNHLNSYIIMKIKLTKNTNEDNIPISDTLE